MKNLNKQDKHIFAIIPARGGSKRIKDKNIQEIGGHPLIHWPITELKKIEYIKDIIVSTDSLKIKKKVSNSGAIVPFLRPKDLSDDQAVIAPVIKHATEWYIENIAIPDYVITVYPTAIFLDRKYIDKAIQIINDDSAVNCVFGATDFSYPIQRAIYIDESNQVQMFNQEHYITRSQDLVTAFHDAGQFYVQRTQSVLNESNNFQSSSRIVHIPRKKVIDIDNKEDLEIAKLMFRVRKYF